MKKISVYLKDNIEKDLKKDAEREGVSLSEYAGELIELGLKIKRMKRTESQEKQDELHDKMPEYLLRVLNICSEVYRSTYQKDKVVSSGEDAEESLNIIKGKVQSYLDGFLGKEKTEY